MKTIHVATDNDYNVLIGEGLVAKLGTLVNEVKKVCSVLVVSDSNVAPLHMQKVVSSLESCGYSTKTFVFKAGEESKTVATYMEIITYLAQNKFNRTDLVVALGGGVVGDMAGFAAATYMRGIDYIQVSTTLLSSIDSSVGGKVAVDLPEGKNLLGAFHQPKLVVIDTDLLQTLPETFWLDGMGEAVKYAVMCGGYCYSIMNNMTIKENIVDFIYECVRIKRDIVVEDEKEGGVRKLLNLGHTIGHAIEKESAFTITHGRAVMMGLQYITHISQKLGLLDEKTVFTINELLQKYEVPTCTYSNKTLISHIGMDKKSKGDCLDIVLVKAIGECEIREISIVELAEVMG
ncbi:MAG: 3-dehydroquinate synthase [Bacillota bacterium]